MLFHIMKIINVKCFKTSCNYYPTVNLPYELVSSVENSGVLLSTYMKLRLLKKKLLFSRWIEKFNYISVSDWW